MVRLVSTTHKTCSVMQNTYGGVLYFNPIQDGTFAGLLTDGDGKKDPPPNICHIYPEMVKLSIVIPYLT